MRNRDDVLEGFFECIAFLRYYSSACLVLEILKLLVLGLRNNITRALISYRGYVRYDYAHQEQKHDR